MISQFYNSKFLSSYSSKLAKQTNFSINENVGLNMDDHGTITESDIRLNALICSFTESIGEFLEENANVEEVLEEGTIAMGIRKAKDKVTNTIVKFTLADKRMSEQMNDKFNRFIKIFKDSRKLASYDKIVKNSIDLSRMVKNFIGSSIIGLLIPGGVPVKVITAAIALIAKTAMDRRTHDQYKGTILNDLRFEIRIVQEKIKDAESKGDIRSKYRLMRIENQLARAIDRIKFGFKD